MVETDRNSKAASSFPESRGLRVILQRQNRRRREGSLAAALAQSMALAVVGTAGAYPSWVLVSGREVQVVLGVAWAINRVDPIPGAPLLGLNGAPLMLAIAFCCFSSVLSGSMALTLDFTGWRRWRSWAPLLHCTTALLIACAAMLGSCLLVVTRRRIRTKVELQTVDLFASPGQSLFLAFLAFILAATAAGLSCISPALVEPQRSFWHFRRNEQRSFYPSRVRTEEFDGVSASLSLRDKPGLVNNLVDDAELQKVERYNCRVHLGKLPCSECLSEKRRRQQETKEERGQRGPQELLPAENKRPANGLESEREEKGCSSGT